MKPRSSQQGAALLVFFLVIIAAGAVFLLSNSAPDDGRVSGANVTTAALAKAKSALLAYAVAYHYTKRPGYHGLLPCPETLNSLDAGQEAGQCGAQYINSLGRLPWYSLQVEPLRDSSGECLWYAVTGDYKNNVLSNMTNDDTPGMFQIFNESASLSFGTTAEDRVVAVIIAPGKPLAGQSRSNADPDLPCKISHKTVSATDYLDSYQGINNAAINTVNKHTVDQFINSNSLQDNPSLNDRFITITSTEIFDAIKADKTFYQSSITTLGLALGDCLIDYANAGAIDPADCPALDTCYADCENTYNLCVASNTGKKAAKCNKDRAKCEQTCRKDTKKSCAKPPKGKKGGGGGGPAADPVYRLPWPAPVDLVADYRLNASYTDVSGAANGYLGRLPYLTPNSSAEIGTADASIFSTCKLDTADIDLFNLWQNWKDHWFYVVGEEFAPDATTPANCTKDCPEFATTRYAGILIFSGERSNAQLRRNIETENPDPAINQSKASISNYLEGANLTNYTDKKGNKTYINTTSDKLFCIPADLTSTSVCAP